ncbi:MAG TPA: ATP-binding cassette domain-containing protein, partial [Candidatus Hydrogenedentes bacterium]|nr:ATP-binding cassette domain-containing protein [Candidatus Hydrogenedentota bacterium]
SCRERAEELLVKVGLQDRMQHKPGKLSGGEQQRVAIARALFNRPALALCDEPTGNLDERTGAEIIALLFTLNREENTTFVLVTHDEHLAERADCWAALHEGYAELRRC